MEDTNNFGRLQVCATLRIKLNGFKGVLNFGLGRDFRREAPNMGLVERISGKFSILRILLN